MNAILLFALKAWGICVIINFLGFFILSRLTWPNGNKDPKRTVKEYFFSFLVGPLATIFLIFDVVAYLGDWAVYLWDKIKDIKI